MKKIILMTALFSGFCYAANAGGYCRLGSAALNSKGGGIYTLSCPGNGVCYETDNTGIVGPGHMIYIHYAGTILEAEVLSGGSSTPPDTPPSDTPTDQLPETVIVQVPTK